MNIEENRDHGHIYCDAERRFQQPADVLKVNGIKVQGEASSPEHFPDPSTMLWGIRPATQTETVAEDKDGA